MVYRQIIGLNRGEILLPVLYRRSGLMTEWSLLALRAMNLLLFYNVHIKDQISKTGIFHRRSRSSLRCL